jgi:cysteinyl-tRNA synthetase
MIRLYNSLGRNVEEFTPIKPGEVALYTCGPTVYDYMHIGNLRKFIFDDTLKRMLLSQGAAVNHVMNVTDVGHLVSDGDEGEDKLEKGARNSGKTVWDVAQLYLDAFVRDMKLVNVIEPSQLIRATDAIAQQIKMVTVLLEKDFAYITKEAIYFDVSKLPDYGVLTGQKLADKQVGARDEVVTETSKRNPQDFAVWFFTVGHFADHQMRWESPWGKGFPGWHLECSAIIEKSLGETIDIHTGGIDNLGTHHVNEMAQSEAAHDGAPLANYWMHLLHLHVDGTKMSKSLGNFYTLEELTEKGYSPLAFRLLMLQAHYRSELNFTWAGLRGAQTRLSDLYGWASLQHDTRKLDNDAYPSKVLDQGVADIKEALADDLATPKALSILSGLVDATPGVPKKHWPHFIDILHELDKLFGLDLANQADISDEHKAMIAEREEAKDAGTFKKADDMRDRLLKQNIELLDTPSGTRWKRKAIF